MTNQETEYPTRINEDDYSPISRNRCCFNFPCFQSSPTIRLGGATIPSSSPSHSLWDRIRAAETNDRWWAKPITAIIKIREWSEIVAGPKWKTFIRRFNRRHRHHHSTVPAGKFQYDPLSYSLNFDEGHEQNGQFEEECGQQFPDFSSRFAAAPLPAG